MAHELFNFISRVANNPQLAAPEYMDFAIKFLVERSNNPQMALSGTKSTEEDVQYDSQTGVGIIPILGPLTYTPIVGMCGEHGYSYQRVQSDFMAMAAAGAKLVVLDIDSPGGMAYGCFETANFLRDKADEYGIGLVAYVDGLASSAAYGLASAAHKIVVNPAAEVGSIGVVVSLVNISKAEKRMGIERTYVYAGDSKIPFDKEGNFREEFLNDIQEKVDTLYSSFIEHVSELRNLSQDDVRNTEAKTFTSAKAISLGLADSVMNREEFFTYLSDIVQTGNTMSLKDRLFGPKKLSVDEVVTGATLSQLQEEVKSLVVERDEAMLANTDLTQKLTAKDETIATLTAQLDAVNAALSASEVERQAAEAKVAEFLAAQEKQIADAAQAKADARKQKLSALVGDEQGEVLFATVGMLDDAGFEVVLKSLQSTVNLENSSAMFTETGLNGGGDGIEVIDGDATTKILKQKYTNVK